MASMETRSLAAPGAAFTCTLMACPSTFAVTPQASRVGAFRRRLH